MSLDDFCRLDAEEFQEVSEAWHARREAEDRDAWSRMRMLAAITIHPHVKGTIKPERLLPFPWEQPSAVGSEPQRTQMHLSKEESKERFEKLVKRVGG
ncbi:MAG: hypothetical protein IJV36_07765 [Prevotella sp.]|nr:hypothetical protein [Prevotella sp.]